MSVVRPKLAVGPVMPGWGSWDWVGTFLAEELEGPFETSTFTRWQIPDADAVVVVKHAPPAGWAEEVARRSALIYCPIDHYGAANEIDADATWLRKCAKVLVHSHRLEPHFAPLVPTAYVDHPLNFVTRTRAAFRPDGPLLWVGVRSNLPPLVAWVNAHPLPAPLDVLTNPETPGAVPPPAWFGFRSARDVRVHEWTPERHLEFTTNARAALDVKGDDFRSRHKPPAKAIDFVASGLPLAMNPGTSPVEHLAALGLDVPSPLDADRWLSEEYWNRTRSLGERLARELAPDRIAERCRALIEEALTARPRPVSVAKPGRPNAEESPAPPRAVSPVVPIPPVPVTPRSDLRLYGLMVTKDDHAVFADWCRDQLRLYDAVVCLDGSAGDETARIADRFGEKLVYLHERDFALPHKTDHGLRAAVHREIVRRFGPGHWVMCCHADEFCYHDPRKIAAVAERDGFDQVSWFSPHFYPHPDEWPDWPWVRHLPVPERFEHYHWDYRGDGLPWCEDRLYRDGPGVAWDGETHGSVRPNGLKAPAPYRATLRHFKVLVTDPAFYDVSESAAHYGTHWVGTSGRTGLPFPVREPKDLFVGSVRNYARCDRFAGTFPHPWNIGDEFRPNPPDTFGGPARRYREARALAARGEPDRARPILVGLDVGDAVPAFRALVKNDLATLAAVVGERDAAVAGFRAALELDPACPPARANLDALQSAESTEPELVKTAAPLPAPVCAGRRATKVAVLSFLFNWPSTGGGNVHTAELTRFLAEAGYDVKHLYATFGPWRVGQVTEPTPHPAEPVAFAEADWTAETIVARFRAAVDEFDPDWVVLTDSWNMKPLLAAAAGGRPYVLRLQALECLCPLNNVRLLPGTAGAPRQCTRHQLATPDDCARCVRDLDHTSGDLHRAERALAGVGTPEYRAALFGAFAGAAAVLAVNPLTAAMVEPHAKDVRVVTAGMDPARFPWPFPDARKAAPTPGRLRVLFAGLTHEWMKGFHVLRAACDRLWSVRADFEVVVTDVPPEDRPAEAWARYVGWQSQEHLSGHLAGADIVVVPTVAQEALGRTAVEAMAAGKPAVASRIGGLPFTVADGATGLLCTPDDPTDLGAKLTELFDAADLRDRLGREGRKRFEEHYAWPAVIDRHYRPLFGAPDRAVEPRPAPPPSSGAGAEPDRPPVLVVVAHDAGRPVEPLVRLLDSAAAHPAGCGYAVRIVVSRDGRERLDLPARHRGLEVVYRETVGGTIGAWEAGWRAGPPHAGYLFMRDDCVVVRGNWVGAFAAAASAPGVGLVGECLSPDWDAPWPVLAEKFRGHELREHTIDGRPAERVACYLDFMRRRGIPPGPRGDHLQALVLFATRAVLERVSGFPACRGYGETVGAEIGTSKIVQAVGLRLVQVEPAPFTHIEQPQWAHRRGTPAGAAGTVADRAVVTTG